MTRKEILDTTELEITLNRLCCELIENHDGFENTVLIGLQPRGVSLAKRLKELLIQNYGISNIPLGSLDMTFFRDDFRRRDEPLKANQTRIDFLVEGKKVIFVDDVLYTGRSVRAALDAIQSFGRPSSIELLVLIDRRFSRDLPIQPDYKGRQVDSIATEKVQVNWKEEHGQDAVYIITSDKNE
ncbi:MAG: bifunctional pyr operon transcriptional regulator/uracil phosphoribosyltransferase PyrR [Bacteroidota bacterium]|nr:bifunctional pyr operon transcriptional regulator/uracil phosphoribosyltransferase PyrR [Bacteroidota bacterium]